MLAAGMVSDAEAGHRTEGASEIMNDDHVRPKLLGLTLTGSWRDCPVLQDAHDTGSIVLDDSDLCEAFPLAL